MFPSISKAIPGAVVTTQFVSLVTAVLTIVTPMTIQINGIAQNTNLVAIYPGDTVLATVLAPIENVDFCFYSYQLDAVPQSFAVVTQSIYMVHMAIENREKRWYQYTPSLHTLSFYNQTKQISALSFGKTATGEVSGNLHIILEPIARKVFFYNNNGIQVNVVSLPSSPIDYAQLPELNSVAVLTSTGDLYSITGSTTTKILEFALTCIVYDGTYLYAGGSNGTIYIIDPHQNYNIVSSFTIIDANAHSEVVLNIAAFSDQSALILVTQTNRIYRLDIPGGNLILLHQGTAIRQPALFNSKIYIPESEVGILLVYNPTTLNFEAPISLTEFSPSYIQVIDNTMYVCGNDNNNILMFDSNLTQTSISFTDKVTWISILSGTIIASHWLKSFQILDIRGLYRIVDIQFQPRVGPVSHIGTNISQVKTLGSDSVIARTPTGITLWVNGQRSNASGTQGTLLYNGDYLSINYPVHVEGISRTNCIIGDTVYDYDVTAVAQTFYPRNLNIEIQDTGNLGIQTRQIILPRFFTPCYMSVEYGDLLVNGTVYYGERLVAATDVITIKTLTGKPNGPYNSVLPILTLGTRQFALPIATNFGRIPTVVTESTNLALDIPITEEITVIADQSLSDYIIPSYYNVVIKKNGVDITGNYNQQFGAEDKISVEYHSSPLRYDKNEAVILGPTNYIFVAKNLQPELINYTDFGNIVYPYPRFNPLRPVNIAPWELSSPYNDIEPYYVNEYQANTIPILISGISTDANIRIVGGDSYLMKNGNLILDSSGIPGNSTTVISSDQIELGRTVLNLFDDPVYLVQTIADPDYDGLFLDIEIGKWGIVNQDLPESAFQTISNSILFPPPPAIREDTIGCNDAALQPDLYVKSCTQLASYDSSRYYNLTCRLFSPMLQPDIDEIETCNSAQLEFDYTTSLKNLDSSQLEFDYTTSLKNLDSAQLEFDYTTFLKNLDSAQLEFDYTTFLKNLDSAQLEFDYTTFLKNLDSAQLEFDYTTFLKNLDSAQLEFDYTTFLKNLDSAQLEFDYTTSLKNLDSAQSRFEYTTSLKNLDSAQLEFEYTSLRKLDSAQLEFDYTTSLRNLDAKLLVYQEMILPITAASEQELGSAGYLRMIPSPYNDMISNEVPVSPRAIRCIADKLFYSSWPLSLASNQKDNIKLPEAIQATEYKETYNTIYGTIPDLEATNSLVNLTVIRASISIDEILINPSTNGQGYSWTEYSIRSDIPDIELVSNLPVEANSVLPSGNYPGSVVNYPMPEHTSIPIAAVVDYPMPEHTSIPIAAVVNYPLWNISVPAGAVVDYPMPEHTSIPIAAVVNYPLWNISVPAGAVVDYPVWDISVPAGALRHLLAADYPVWDISVPAIAVVDYPVWDISVPAGALRHLLAADYPVWDISVPAIAVVDYPVCDIGAPAIAVVDYPVWDISVPAMTVVDYPLWDISVPVIAVVDYPAWDISVPVIAVVDYPAWDISVPVIAVVDYPAWDISVPAGALRHLLAADYPVWDIGAPAAVVDVKIDFRPPGADTTVISGAIADTKVLHLSSGKVIVDYNVDQTLGEANNSTSYTIDRPVDAANNSTSYTIDRPVDAVAQTNKYTIDQGRDVGSSYILANWEISLDRISTKQIEFAPDKNAIVFSNTITNSILDSPQLSFEKTVVQFDQGYVWDNNIDLTYGVFATSDDAMYAARAYQQVHPYQILDSDLWTYRILFDTNLVCLIPKGRYPVARLLRGG